MTYATQMQIQIAAGGSARLIQLTDQEGTGSINTAVLAQAQADAEGWMHECIRLRHAVPVVNLSPEGAATMARLSAAETVYRLIEMTRVIGQSDVDGRASRKLELEAIRDGKIRIDDPVPAKSSAVQANIVTREGPVTRRGMRGLW